MEAQSLQTDAEEIENKFEERKRLDEQRERERVEREKQLAIAREYKRHMKPPTVEDNEISRPKMPQFDRSMKPQTMSMDLPSMNTAPRSPTIWSYERQRDFSPVPGSMVNIKISFVLLLNKSLYKDDTFDSTSVLKYIYSTHPRRSEEGILNFLISDLKSATQSFDQSLYFKNPFE